MEIVGRIVANAEVKTVSDDRKVTNFTVAVNDRYKNQEGTVVEKTAFFNCAYWIGSGIAVYLTKGTIVQVNGTVSANAWIDQKGEARASLNVHANSIKLHSGGKQEAGTKKQSAQPVEITEPIDDLPF